MPRALILFAPVIKPALPRCEAQRIYLHLLDKYPNYERQCRHSARYCIDGVNLCMRHAGIRALEILTKD